MFQDVRMSELEVLGVHISIPCLLSSISNIAL